MSQLARVLISIAVLATAGGCSVVPPRGEVCTNAVIESTNDALALRSVASKCSSSTEIYASAISKLNNLPPPSVRKISLSPIVPLAEAERARFEVDVFFNVLEAYPPDVAFERLDELLRRSNTTFRLESIRVVGAQDRSERDL